MVDAKEYGRALFLLSEEDGDTDELKVQVEIVQEVLSANPTYTALLDTPALTKEERLSAIDESFGMLNVKLTNLVKIMAEKRCAYLLASAMSGFLDEYDNSRGIERVEAVTSVPMSEEQIARLSAKLGEKTGKTIIVKNTVDATILGGMKLRYMGERIKNGEMGDIYQVTAIMNTRHDPKKRDWLNKFPGGIQYYLGCHMIDFVLQLQGLPEKIHPFIKYTMTEGVKAPDLGHAVFEYPNGISTVEATSAEVNGYGRRQLIVCGTKGTYEIEPLEAPTHAYFIPLEKSSTYSDRRGEEIALPKFDGLCRYDTMMHDFAKCIRGEAKNPFSYTYELTLQKLLMYCCGDTSVDWKTVTEI